MVVAGESAIAGLAGLLYAARNKNARQLLDLNSGSRILLFGMEGARAPRIYRALESQSCICPTYGIPHRFAEGSAAGAEGSVNWWGLPRRPKEIARRLNLIEGIEFTEGTLPDCQDVAILQTESWRNAYRDILPASYLDGPIVGEREAYWRNLMLSAGQERRRIFLARDRGVLVGFACVLLDEEPAWGARLDNIHVKPAYRGRGFGRLLFASAAGWVSKCEPRWPMHLLVFEANYAARRFYEEQGGKVVEQHAQETPAGVLVPSLRFLWQKPGTIARL